MQLMEVLLLEALEAELQEVQEQVKPVHLTLTLIAVLVVLQQLVVLLVLEARQVHSVPVAQAQHLQVLYRPALVEVEAEAGTVAARVEMLLRTGVTLLLAAEAVALDTYTLHPQHQTILLVAY